MSRFHAKFESITKQHFAKQPRPKEVDAPERYVLRGDDAAWAKTKPRSLIGWGHELCDALPDPRRLEAEDRRAIQVIVLACGDYALGRWLNGHLEVETPGDDMYGPVRAALTEQPRTAELILPWTGQSVSAWENDAGVTSAGRFLLSLSDADLGIVAKHSGSYQEANPGSRIALIEFLFKHRPMRVPALGQNLFAPTSDWVNGEVVETLIAAAGPACEPVVADFVERTSDLWTKFAAASQLAGLDSKKYYRVAERAGLAILSGKADGLAPGQYGPVAEWLLKHGDNAVVPKIAECLTNSSIGGVDFDEILNAATATIGKAALPLIRASLQCDELSAPDGPTAIAFPQMFPRLQRLMQFREPSDDALIVKRIKTLMADEANCQWDRLTQLAVASHIPDAIGCVWDLAGHKSKPVRFAAVSALATLVDDAIPRSEALLQHRKVDVRETAVRILSAIPTSRAQEVLEAHLTEEGATRLVELIREQLRKPKHVPAARAKRTR